jgi:hypothetical protein
VRLAVLGGWAFYTDLRETWERLVEEVLLGKVVEQFNRDVKTQSLKGVVVRSFGLLNGCPNARDTA